MNASVDEVHAAALTVAHLSVSYGRQRALDKLSFEVARGRFFALFGPSSVGKTTTLRAICGLVKPDGGRITIGGRDVTHAPIRGRGVAMVFQSFALYPHLSVADNFAYPLREAGLAGADIRRRINDTAEMLRLGHRLKAKPSTLSGGEQQRVALGRALIRQPDLLLLDEPLTNLDAKLRHDMRAELKRLHRQFGMTIVYATPDELEALSMGEEIAVMRDGRIVQIGTPDDVYEHPVDVYVAAKIGSPHMNLFDSEVAADGRGVATAFGELAVSHGHLEPGLPVTAGIRPADIRIGADHGQGQVARVSLIEPLGDITVVSLDTPGPTLRAVLPEATAAELRRGDQLPIVIPAERVHLFRKADGRAIERSG
ncbi:MAG: ABC transporter ATP-binding protein [Geminicoccaceae bacterium]